MKLITPPHNIGHDVISSTSQSSNNSAITSITKGPRQSNFELLRIVAMFMVLIVHADFLSLDRPTAAEYVNVTIASFCRVFFEMLAIICVNVFILISGWFTIKPSIKGACNFLFQCSFIIIAIYCISFLGGWYHPTMGEWIFNGIFYNASGFWFIKAYLILFILAPVLNSYVIAASKYAMISVLLGFFAIQILSTTTLFNLPYFQLGYSPLSFIGLYLLAQTIKRHFNNYRTRIAYVLFFGSLVVNTLYFFIMNYFQLWNPIVSIAYSNPLVIVQATGLLMIFNRIHLTHNKIINWISASSFAVYLVHIHPAIFEYFKDTVVEIYTQTQSVGCLIYIFGFLCMVYAAAIIIDQPRKYIWRYLRRVFPAAK